MRVATSVAIFRFTTRIPPGVSTLEEPMNRRTARFTVIAAIETIRSKFLKIRSNRGSPLRRETVWEIQVE